MREKTLIFATDKLVSWVTIVEFKMFYKRERSVLAICLIKRRPTFGCLCSALCWSREPTCEGDRVSYTGYRLQSYIPTVHIHRYTCLLAFLLWNSRLRLHFNCSIYYFLFSLVILRSTYSQKNFTLYEFLRRWVLWYGSISYY